MNFIGNLLIKAPVSGRDVSVSEGTICVQIWQMGERTDVSDFDMGLSYDGWMSGSEHLKTAAHVDDPDLQGSKSGSKKEN